MTQYKIETLFTTQGSRTYYVEAESWEEAEQEVTHNILIPDEETFLNEEIKTEEMK